MTITHEIRQAIDQAGEQPVRVDDPETRTQYVILKAEVYDRMRSLLEAEEIDPSFFEFGDFIPLKREAD